MSSLYVVRHAQASLFAENYDQLSELGFEQAQLLGEYWSDRGLIPHRSYTGTLARQIQTADGVGDALAAAGNTRPERVAVEGLNEYPAEDIMRVLVPALRDQNKDVHELAERFEHAVDYQSRYRSLHKLLAIVMYHWIEGSYVSDEPLITWTEFSSGVRHALEDIMRASGSGKLVAIFTSGGPIGVSVQTALNAPDKAAADLNWRVYNASVTRYTYSGPRFTLDAFNDTAHLPVDRLSYR